jgi:hypothetical protein
VLPADSKNFGYSGIYTLDIYFLNIFLKDSKIITVKPTEILLIVGDSFGGNLHRRERT